MRRACLPPLLAAFCLLASAMPHCPADIEQDIQAALKGKVPPKASIGIHVVRLDPGQSSLVYKFNSNVPLKPASNMKLITTSAILDQLGADYKFRTLLVQRGRNLILVGDGDPTFGDAELLKKSGWTPTTGFKNWAADLKKAGLTGFDNLFVDDSVFDEVLVHPNWDTKQLLSAYSAQVAGMTLNVGCIDFRIHATSAGKSVTYTTTPPTRYVTVQNACVSGAGSPGVRRQLETNAIALTGFCPSMRETSITIHDPAMYAGTVLAETLAENGIKVKGKISRDRTVRAALAAENVSADIRLLAVHETPLLQAITHANKESQNLYAESMCKRLGAAVTGQSGSWANGTAAAAAFLKKLGVEEGELKLDDGSGLSHANRVTADAIIRVLEYNWYGKNRDAFLATLPVGGQDGTLERRFKNGMRGRVFAKTGYINTVGALSGYIKGKDDQWYAFSILINNLPNRTNPKEAEDEIVKTIYNIAADVR